MMKEKQKLQNEIIKLRNKLDKINELEAQEKSSKLFRKCFKARNNYSMPDAPSDYWFLYVKVIHCDGSRVTTMQFETDKDGCCFYTPNKSMSLNMISSYTEINEDQFDKEFEKFKQRIVLK